MVTAELACALPVLLLVALAAVAAVQVAQAKVRCADAAREAARAVARGDADSAVRIAQSAAGRPVTLSRATGTDLTTVTVRFVVHPLRVAGAVTISETAVAATEPGDLP